jgi:hypothetical protein
MQDETGIILVVEIVILLIAIVLAFIYIIPIIFIRRFHTVTNILTGNVCIATILCSCFWATNYMLVIFSPMIFIEFTTLCSLSPYLQALFDCLIIYALVMITINRFFTVTYPQKRLFKRKTWSFISLGVHWLIVIMLPLPNLTLLSEINVRREKAIISNQFESSF